jgi:hypothetical protein
MADRDAKQRQAHGVRNAGAKLTERDVRVIRKSPGPEWKIAKRFKVCEATINSIRRRQTWKLI